MGEIPKLSIREMYLALFILSVAIPIAILIRVRSFSQIKLYFAVLIARIIFGKNAAKSISEDQESIGMAEMITDKCIKVGYQINQLKYHVYIPFDRKRISTDIQNSVVAGGKVLRQQPGVRFFIRPDDLDLDNIYISNDDDEISTICRMKLVD